MRALGAALLLALAGCEQRQQEQPLEQQPQVQEQEPEQEAQVQGRAAAALDPVGGSQVQGTVAFVETSGGMHVITSFTGLGPEPHTIQVHQGGTCEDPGEPMQLGLEPIRADERGISKSTRVLEGGVIRGVEGLEGRVVGIYARGGKLLACGEIHQTTGV